MNITELKKVFDNCDITEDKIIIKDKLTETLKFIKENYEFNILKEIVAIDNKDKGIELIYRLYSVENEEEALISISVKNEAESVSKIFDSAYADEKEIYDLFGVQFIGNDELKRLYMPEAWEGHPLKKDYNEQDERLKWNE
ncbi:MAG: NADH-quinone oxidoreductase subunit C [Cyanobacteria bacterium SIG28]|nr:NADH-quinone oxidoreductase subunit C [Cyanobacteria bacterium SIG28]